jgi:segregation and condensation protein B
MSKSLKLIVESLLFASDKPLSAREIHDSLPDVQLAEIKSALEDLKQEYEEMGRSFILKDIANGYQFRSHSEYGPYILKMLQTSPSRLSRAALETLSIIAYKQPILRQEIERYRGVDVGGILRMLGEKDLVKIMGREDLPGRPLIYGTTKKFLEVFDLQSIEALPKLKEIEALGTEEHEPTTNEEDTFPNGEDTFPNEEDTSPNGDANSTDGEDTSPNREDTSPNGDANSTDGEDTSPNREDTSPNRDANSPNREDTSPNRDTTSPNREDTSPNREDTPPNRDANSPNREDTSPNRDANSTDGETLSANEETIFTNTETNLGQGETIFTNTETNLGQGGPSSQGERSSPEVEGGHSGEGSEDPPAN